MRQVDWSAAQHLLSSFSSPFFGVKLLDDYGFWGRRGRPVPTRWSLFASSFVYHCQLCTGNNCPRFKPNILRHKRSWAELGQTKQCWVIHLLDAKQTEEKTDQSYPGRHLGLPTSSPDRGYSELPAPGPPFSLLLSARLSQPSLHGKEITPVHRTDAHTGKPKSAKNTLNPEMTTSNKYLHFVGILGPHELKK